MITCAWRKRVRRLWRSVWRKRREQGGRWRRQPTQQTLPMRHSARHRSAGKSRTTGWGCCRTQTRATPCGQLREQGGRGHALRSREQSPPQEASQHTSASDSSGRENRPRDRRLANNKLKHALVKVNVVKHHVIRSVCANVEDGKLDGHLLVVYQHVGKKVLPGQQMRALACGKRHQTNNDQRKRQPLHRFRNLVESPC